MILDLGNGKYLHTAYSITNIPEDMTEEDWSLDDQEGYDYVGTFIDSNSAEDYDPSKYVWEELVDEDVDDTDDEGEFPVADYQQQIDALYDQMDVMQEEADEVSGTVQQQAQMIATNSDVSSTAYDLSLEANEVAQATGQHFWSQEDATYAPTQDTTIIGGKVYYSYDSSTETYTEVTPAGSENPTEQGWYEMLGAGAYVTEQTTDEFKQAPTGSNSLWNSLGMLFRKGMTNLLAILSGGSDGTGAKGIAVYDGEGNADENVVASFTDQGATIGKSGTPRVRIESKSMALLNEDDGKYFECTASDTSSTIDIEDVYNEKILDGETKTITLQGIPTSQSTFAVYFNYRNDTSSHFGLIFTVGTTGTRTINQNYTKAVITYDGNKSLTIEIQEAYGYALLGYIRYNTTIKLGIITNGTRDTSGGDYTLFPSASFTSGIGLIAMNSGEMVCGTYNSPDLDQRVLFQVGNGTPNQPSTAFEVRKDGYIYADNHVIGITEVGTTSNSWDYRLWSDGTYEAWRSYGFTGINVNQSSAGTYYGGSKTLGVPNFPNNSNTGVTQAFGNETAEFSHSSGVYLYQIVHHNATSSSSDIEFQFRAHASATNTNCGLDIYIRGTYS